MVENYRTKNHTYTVTVVVVYYQIRNLSMIQIQYMNHFIVNINLLLYVIINIIYNNIVRAISRNRLHHYT